MVSADEPYPIFSKRKAISTLLPHAIFLEQGGQQGTIDTIFRAARASGSEHFMWRRIALYVSRLFEKRSHPSLDRVITLISPYLPWRDTLNSKIMVERWAAAASAIPYTEEVGWSVVGALLRIAFADNLRSRIPTQMWEWMKKKPSLPPMYHKSPQGKILDVFLFVSQLGDIELLKLYLLLVWSDRRVPDPDNGYTEKSVKEAFGGVGMECHRRDLIERLDHVLRQLDERLENCRERRYGLYREYDLKEAKKTYTKYKDALLEVDGQ